MRYAVWAPLVISLVIALAPRTASIRTLPDRLAPRLVLPLYLGCLSTLALATAASLAFLVAGTSTSPAPSAATHGHAAPGGVPLAVIAGLTLLVAAYRTIRAAQQRRLRHRALLATIPSRPRGPVVVEDDSPFAVAIPHRGPGGGGGAGVIAVSRGLLELLEPREWAAVRAHEQEHLDGRHHRALALTALSIAMNPLLLLWWHEVAYCVERCADERAARVVGDRRLVAHTITRIATAGRALGRPARGTDTDLRRSAELAIGAGPVPRRVAALLDTRAPHAGLAGVAVLAAPALLIVLTVVAGAITAHAAWDLHWVLGPLAR